MEGRMMASLNMTINVENMPEVISRIRLEMAKMLRSEAEGEPRIVAKKLLELAALFEVGGES
jgi:hypothetical protein